MSLSEQYLQTEGEEISKLLQKSNKFDNAVAARLKALFQQEPDLRKHGALLWSIMFKEPGISPPVVLAKRCGVYLQYYLLVVACKNPHPSYLRFLTVPELCFLTSIAAAGFERARAMVDAIVDRKADWVDIQALHITRESFLAFFYQPTGFCFLNCVQIISQLWDVWDNVHPKIIHGFITPYVSKLNLEARISKLGTFILRFDSSGGLTIDFIASNGALASGKVDPSALTSPEQFIQLIVTSPTLTGLVDTRREASADIIPKEQLSSILAARVAKLAQLASSAPGQQAETYSKSNTPVAAKNTSDTVHAKKSQDNKQKTQDKRKDKKKEEEDEEDEEEDDDDEEDDDEEDDEDDEDDEDEEDDEDDEDDEDEEEDDDNDGKLHK